MSVLGKLKQQEYIGENRCLPCTTVNIAIGAGVSAALAKRSKILGGIALGGSVIAIYFRGYLVPGTPEFTKRYMPKKALELFGKSPTLGGRTREAEKSQDMKAEVDIENLLLDANIATQTSDGSDLVLSPSFRSDWDQQITEVKSEGIHINKIINDLELEQGSYTITEHDEARVLERNNDMIGKWPSEAALIIDIAAANIISGWIDGWSDLNGIQQGKLLNSLRIFIDECPSGEDVKIGTDIVESCCSEHEVITGECAGTGERVFEQAVMDH